MRYERSCVRMNISTSPKPFDPSHTHHGQALLGDGGAVGDEHPVHVLVVAPREHEAIDAAAGGVDAHLRVIPAQGKLSDVVKQTSWPLFLFA